MAKAKEKNKQPAVESIGEKLRKTREEKGISLEEARRSTKIHTNILEAIEADRLENVLGKTYVKAFLKKYAVYLGVDEKEIVKEYVSADTPDVKPGPILRKKPLEQENIKLNYSAIIRMILIVLVCVIGFRAIKSRNRGGGEAVKEKRPVMTESQEPVDVKSEAVKEGFIPIPRSRTIKLTIKTTREVWLKVVRDGELTFHGILPGNANETWQANNDIRISEIGRPEALALNVNGKNISISGKLLGKNILITHEGVDLEPK